MNLNKIVSFNDTSSLKDNVGSHCAFVHFSVSVQEDERVLVRRLMLCLRAGQMSEAQEKCISSGQPWRAAALEGWKLHHDPNVTDPTQRNAVTGNPYRYVIFYLMVFFSCS